MSFSIAEDLLPKQPRSLLKNTSRALPIFVRRADLGERRIVTIAVRFEVNPAMSYIAHEKE